MDQAPLLNLGLESLIEFAAPADEIAVDTEGDLQGISFAFENAMGAFASYIPFDHIGEDNQPELCHKFWEIAQTKTIAFHHAGHDIPILERHGFPEPPNWYCTMMMEHFLDENAPSFSLDACSRRHGGMPKNRPEIMEFVIRTQGWDYIPVDLMNEYSSHDALITLELLKKRLPKFRAEEFDGELWDYEKKFILLVAKMIERGIRIDPYFCLKKIIKGEKEMTQIRKQLGFNPGSRIGLEHLLLDQLQLPTIEVSEKTGKPSFNKKVMEQYDLILEGSQDKRASLILRYRGFQKTTSANYRAYINLADESGVLHPGYKLHGTVTSRLSCENPALHQIPRESPNEWNGDLKQAFVPREGFGLWEFDYAQLEFRLAGAYSQEPLLLEIFNTEGRNLFREMAEELGWEYEPTKRFNYSTLYGGGVNNTSRVFGVSRTMAQAMINRYYRTYSHLKEAQNEVARLARNRGFVRYWSGRRRHNVQPHKAFNSVIQGGAAELVKRAMIRLDEEVCDENCFMLLQIHDAVVFEIRTGTEDEYLKKIRKIMETPPIDFGVQFPVEIKPFGGTLEGNLSGDAS